MAKYEETVLTGAALPARLGDLPSPPPVLYVRGELPRGPAVTIVGTRHPTAPAKRYARTLARELASAGVAVLSGGALGIDAAAHRGALDAGGVGVVIAPSGWERMSPKRHHRLFYDVVRKGGAYVSLGPSDSEASYATYFPRNGVLAALAHVVVVVEAPFKSGARNTAATARRIGRPLFVCAAPPWSPNGLGCTEELRLGARPLRSARDILRELAEQRAHPLPPARFLGGPAGQLTLPGSNEETDRKLRGYGSAAGKELLLQALRAGPAHPDELCESTGLGLPQVLELLLTLRLDGVLVSDASGRVTFVKS